MIISRWRDASRAGDTIFETSRSSELSHEETTGWRWAKSQASPAVAGSFGAVADARQRDISHRRSTQALLQLSDNRPLGSQAPSDCGVCNTGACLHWLVSGGEDEQSHVAWDSFSCFTTTINCSYCNGAQRFRLFPACTVEAVVRDQRFLCVTRRMN